MMIPEFVDDVLQKTWHHQISMIVEAKRNLEIRMESVRFQEQQLARLEHDLVKLEGFAQSVDSEALERWRENLKNPSPQDR